METSGPCVWCGQQAHLRNEYGDFQCSVCGPYWNKVEQARAQKNELPPQPSNKLPCAQCGEYWDDKDIDSDGLCPYHRRQ